MLISILFILAGLLLMADAGYIMLRFNTHLGVLLTMAAGIFFLVWGALYTVLVALLGAAVMGYILSVFGVLLFVCAALCLFLILYGRRDTVCYDETALIVLGCGIRGEKLSPALRMRLDRALRYHRENEDAYIVVSGGQGPQEDITEALAMERYLIAHGIPADRILKEERSTSTEENFVFSKKLLDEKLGAGYRIAFVSNDYHIYRASRLAAVAGLNGERHLHTSTPIVSALPNSLREGIATVKLWIFGR